MEIQQEDGTMAMAVEELDINQLEFEEKEKELKRERADAYKIPTTTYSTSIFDCDQPGGS